MNKPLRLVILGGGTAGWMAANLFAKTWPQSQCEVTLIESPEVGIVGVGEGSTPTLRRFFEKIEVPESEWMPRCNATYKVNIRFHGWSPASGVDSYSHPFSSQIDTFSQRAFYVNCMTRRMGLDVNTCPEDFFINGVLANQNKGPVPPENFPFNMAYGYHFDSHLLGKFLAELAVQRGVRHFSETIVDVGREENGDITYLNAQSGRKIEGDLFVDCTGFASVLMQKTLKVPFRSFKENLFNDRAVVMPTPIADEIPVETSATALKAGWCWKIPLTHRFGNGYVYSSDFISEDQAETEFRQHIGMTESDQPCRHLKMRVGQLESHWRHNCLGLGLSQGFIEPLEATALHLVQVAIEFFIDKFKKGNYSAQYRDSYNTEMHERFERVRDYIVAHYKLNTRADTDYWRANRDNMKLSESLLGILDTWYRVKDLSEEFKRQKIETHFSSASWHCLLAGYGAFPPSPPNQPNRGDRYQELDLERFFKGCALNFSSHTSNLSELKD